MKKTLIASVVAATLAGNVLADDQASNMASKLDAMPTIYGNIQLVHQSTDNDVVSTHEFQNNGSTIGIKHEHMISEGTTAFGKAEFEFSADDKSTSGGINRLDEAYIGVKGDFGSAQVGSDDTVYEWVNVLDTSENVGLGSRSNPKEGDNLQYVSPEISEGLVLGLTAPIDSDTNFAGALAAKYAMDNLEVAFAYAMGREDGGVDQEDTIGLGASYSMDEITLLAQYETTKDDNDSMGLQGMYAMGQNVFALGYQVVSYDGGEDESDIYLQALHNLSDNAYIYLEYLMQTDLGGVDGSDLDTLAIGATYTF